MDPQNKMCILDEDKICDDCGECDRCDLDPNKICDNCCKCIDSAGTPDFKSIEIDAVFPELTAIEQIEPEE